jgi:hypothetical protein
VYFVGLSSAHGRPGSTGSATLSQMRRIALRVFAIRVRGNRLSEADVMPVVGIQRLKARVAKCVNRPAGRGQASPPTSLCTPMCSSGVFGSKLVSGITGAIQKDASGNFDAIRLSGR